MACAASEDAVRRSDGEAREENGGYRKRKDQNNRQLHLRVFAQGYLVARRRPGPHAMSISEGLQPRIETRDVQGLAMRIAWREAARCKDVLTAYI